MVMINSQECSSAETVEGSALTLKGVHDIEGGDGLPLGVFGVSDGVTDHVLEERSEHSAGLLVDVGADALDTTSAGESADSGLGDAHDGLLERFAGWESLGSLFAAFAFSSNLCSSCHC